MIRVILILVALLVPASAMAQQQNEIPSECRLLPDHKPDAGVAYQPGVDVHGRSVVPAEINATPFGDAMDTIVVPLTVDLAQRLPSQTIQGLQLDGNLGYLEISKDGRVSHNGQDWTSQVHILCGKQPALVDGQPPEDVIKYEPAKVPAAEPAMPKAQKPPTPVVAPTPPPGPKQGELIQGEEFREEGHE